MHGSDVIGSVLLIIDYYPNECIYDLSGKLHALGEISEKSWSPNVGLEPTTLRLRVSCSTD